MNKLKRIILILGGSVYFIWQCVWANMAPPFSRLEFKKNYEFPFIIYTDKGTDNHYVPSGWIGDFGDLKCDNGWEKNPHTGKTCIKITYSAMGSQKLGWAGIYWQYFRDAYDLTGAKRITFWARGEKGNEVIKEFKIGGMGKNDSVVAGIGPVKLTTKWKQYTIELEGKDLSRIASGFCWIASRDKNPDGLVMYLDDIKYEK